MMPRGIAAETKRLLELCTEIVATRGPISVRGVCYQLFVREAIPSMQKAQTQKVSRLLVYARERGIIEWEDIVDESRTIERPAMWTDLVAFSQVVARSYRKDYWTTQPYSVQVWSEKGSVGGVLRPITEKYGVPFMAAHGFASATALHDAAQDSATDPRRCVVVYCGDHDASGLYMSEVDLPERLARYGGAAEVKRIALLSSDTLDLPSFRAKASDKRYAWYRARYGKLAWEIDAMDPNRLRDLVEGMILTFIDQAAWQRMQVNEEAEQASVRQVALAMGK
jgi:hypothetical protein